MTHLIEAYRAARAHQTQHARNLPGADYWPGRARDALRVARQRLDETAKRTALPLNLPRSIGETCTTALPGGDVLTVCVTWDDDPSDDHLDNFRITWAKRSVTGPWAHCNDGWLSRDGRTVYGSNGDGARYSATVGAADGYDFPAFVRDARAYKMPRHLCHRYARELVQEEACKLQTIMDTGMAGFRFTVALHDAAGKLIDDDSYGGYDDFDICVTEAEGYARTLLINRAKEIRVDLIGARANGRKAREQFAALRHDLRRHRGAHAPAICALLNGELQRLRDQVTNAFADVRRLSSALNGYVRAGVKSTEARA